MEEKVLRYRKYHKRCRFCKHYKVEVDYDMMIIYDRCKAKDIVIEHADLPRWFCPCYEVKIDGA